MRNVMKTLICITCLISIFATCATVSAGQIEASKMDDIDYVMKTTFEGFFERNGLAFDKSGQDVTARFYNDFYEAYTSKDYDALNQAFNDQLSYVEYDTADQSSSPSPILEMKHNYNKTQTRLVKNSSGNVLSGKTWYLIVTLQFPYIVNDGTFQITYIGAPTISYEYFDLGYGFTGKFTSTQIDGPIYLNNNKRVHFSVFIGCEVYGPGPLETKIHSSNQGFSFNLNGSD